MVFSSSKIYTAVGSPTTWLIWLIIKFCESKGLFEQLINDGSRVYNILDFVKQRM